MVVAIGSQELGSWTFGGLTLLFLIGAFCFGPERLPEWKRRLLGYVCAVSAGLFGFFFTGAITLKFEWEILDYSRIAVQAIGGFALFVFVLWWWGRGDKYGKSKNGSISFEVGPLVSKAIELAEDKGRVEEQIEQLKDELAKAVERTKKLEAEGNRPDAEKALEELRESGDMRRLQELLIQDRDEHRDALIQRNREIAAVAYLRGDIDIASEVVDEILKVVPEDLFAINQRGHIHNLRGRLKEAESDFNKILQLGTQQNNDQARAAALGNLGLIYGRCGELDKAEDAFLKILEIHEKLSDEEGKAKDYGNLGLIYMDKGELEKAEQMHKKSLEISERDRLMLLTANQYGNLGLIYRRRGELDKAEEMLRKSLEISEPSGMLELTANQYGNLGVIYLTRGELDKAEKMFRDGLKIDEKLGKLGGIAAKYNNLGLVYKQRRDIGKAREYWEKALVLFRKIGVQPGVEKIEKRIGELEG